MQSFVIVVGLLWIGFDGAYVVYELYWICFCFVEHGLVLWV